MAFYEVAYFRPGEFAAPEMPQAKRIVAACIAWITPQGLAPIWLRGARCVAVLFQMKAGDVEFVRAGDIGGQRRLGRGRRHLAGGVRFRNPCDHFASRSIQHAQQEIGPGGIFRKR